MKTKINLIVLTLVSLILFFISWQINSSNIDIAVSNYFQSLQSENGLSIMNVISYFGDLWFLIFVSLIIVLVLYKRNEMKNILFYVFILVGGLIGKLLKYVFQSPRPINPIETGFGFPSSHVIGSILIFGAISYFLFKKGNKKESMFIWIFPILIAFSRLYLNVHWFSDVLGGIFFGIFWLCLIIFYFKRK